MTRTALLLFSLFAAACSVGEVGGSSLSPCVDRLVPPSGKHTHLVGGGTNAGLSCVAAGCHLAGQLGASAPAYQFAGTVYKPGGTTPSAGVVVRVTSGGKTATGYTDEAGNFSIVPDAAFPADPFPASSDATACPGVTPMVSQLVAGGGDCNSCHRVGGTAGAPISFADP